MELSLGRRADYALRACVDLARVSDDGARRKSREIGAAMDIPPTYLPQILAQLVRAGLVTSLAGPNGGYALAHAPADVSLLDIIHATEGDPISKECVLRGGPCRWEGMCAMHVPWSEAQQAMLDHLGSTTLADVARIDAELEAGTYHPPAVAATTIGDGDV